MSVLAPDVDDVGGQLTGNFAATNDLTAAAHAVLNTVPYPLDPKPDWFDSLVGHLGDLHDAARDWVTTDGPRVAAGLPQAFLNAGSLAVTGLQDLGAVVAAVRKGGGVPDASQKGQLVALLSALQEQWAEQRRSVAGLQQTAGAFTTRVKALRAPLQADITAANATLTADQQVVDDLEKRIAELQEKLGEALGSARQVERGTDQAGATLAVVVLAFTLAAVTGGAAIPLLAVGGGILSIGLGALFTTRFKQEVLDDIAAIGALQVQLSVEAQQVAGVRRILASLDRVHDAADAASSGLRDSLPLWDDLLTRVGDVLDTLRQPTVDVSRVEALTTLDRAGQAWQIVLQRATNVQSSRLVPAGPFDVANLPAS